MTSFKLNQSSMKGSSSLHEFLESRLKYHSRMFKILWLFACIVYVSGDCSSPHPIPHASLSCSSLNNITKCIVTCQRDYHLHGPHVITCLDSGVWPPFPGVCLRCSGKVFSTYSAINWTENERADVTIQFTCEKWTDMIGSDRMTCDADTGQWNPRTPPVCQPDFSKCGKSGKKKNPKCPRITKKLHKEYKSRKALLSREMLEAIQMVQQELTAPFGPSGLHSRSPGKRRYCFQKMCGIKCIYLSKRSLARMCGSCKRKRIIQCSRNGNIFGR